MVDVLTLNYNDADTTIDFIIRVKEYDVINRILVVDNCSTDDSYERLQAYESGKIQVIQSGNNGGYGAGNNFGIRYLWEKYHSQYILLSNPDVIVDEKTIYELELFLKNNPDYAIAAPVMCDPQMNRQYNTAFKVPTCGEYILSLGMFASKYDRRDYYKNIDNDGSDFMQVGAVSGSMFMMNTEKMIKYGMYDENIFLYCEETVLGLKLKKAGCKTALLTRLYFIHNHSVTISKSFDSKLKRHKLLIKSKLYVIKNHYNANKLQYAFALLLAQISMAEAKILANLRKIGNTSNK